MFAARRFFTPGYWVMLAGMLVLLVIFSIPAAPNHAAAAKGLIPWAGGFYVCFLLPVFAFISAANAIRDDFGAGTVDYIFTRPVRRSTAKPRAGTSKRSWTSVRGSPARKPIERRATGSPPRCASEQTR